MQKSEKQKKVYKLQQQKNKNSKCTKKYESTNRTKGKNKGQQAHKVQKK